MAAYPADVLGVKGTDAALYSQSEDLTLRTVGSFGNGGNTNSGFMETSNSVVGQQGSSGGAVANSNNELLGLISIVLTPGGDQGSSQNGQTGKTIRSLTIASINNSLERYFPGGLSKVILLGTESLSSYFDQNGRAPLTSIITRALSL